MPFKIKTVATAASIVDATGGSFAADISAYLYPSTPIADASAVLAFADAALPVGETPASNNAVIYQDDSIGGAGREQIAVIDQVGTLGGLAMIVQLGAAVAGNMYIVQIGTTNNRAFIAQR